MLHVRCAFAAALLQAVGMLWLSSLCLFCSGSKLKEQPVFGTYCSHYPMSEDKEQESWHKEWLLSDMVYGLSIYMSFDKASHLFNLYSLGQGNVLLSQAPSPVTSLQITQGRTNNLFREKGTEYLNSNIQHTFQQILLNQHDLIQNLTRTS